MADMFILKSFKYNTEQILKDRGIDGSGKVQKFIDSECLRLCEDYIPNDTGALIASGKLHTQIGSGEIKYRTLYARRWYYRQANFKDAPKRGNYWFERMKQQYKQQILKGVKEKVGAT